MNNKLKTMSRNWGHLPQIDFEYIKNEYLNYTPIKDIANKI